MTVLSDLRERVRTVMDAHWRPQGFTVPSGAVYPFRWLWDSCFHAVIWAALGEGERAVSELRFLFRVQEPDGFVPHIDYVGAPGHHAGFWGRPGVSAITQPPMAGHAVAELQRRGVAVPDELVERASRHTDWFLARRHASGLIAISHPWETGCDDSPRFDHWGAADPERWYEEKGRLVTDLRATGGNGLDCAPVSLTALVAWNRRELGLDDDAGLVDALAARWDSAAATFVDGGGAEGTSGRVRTLEALLPLLVVSRGEALAQVTDPAAHGGAFGPAGVHRGEAAFDRRRYWRGPVWPQLAYLLWLAGAPIGEATSRGAVQSGLAEYWDPDDGTGLGAVPQSWAGLSLLMIS